MGAELKNIEIMEDGKVILHREDEHWTMGELHGTTFVMKRDPAIQLMRQWDAYGINAALLDSGLVESVVIIEPSQNLFAMLTDIKAHGRYQKIEDHEPQYFMERKKMQKLTA